VALATFEPLQEMRNDLPKALDFLRRSLASPFPATTREWAGYVWYALARLETKLARRVADGQFPDDIESRIDPTLVRRWNQVMGTFRDLLESVTALKWEMYHLAQALPVASVPFSSSANDPAPGLEVPHERLEQVLAALQETYQAETHLLMDSVTTDIGVGD
jgi:hypothetical protein